MAYPAGVQTVTLRLGSSFDSAGKLASITGHIVPMLGAGADHLVWSATGQTYAKVRTALAWDETEKVALATVPRPTQAGWRDQTQASFSGWSYQITAMAVYESGERQLFERTITPQPGDTVIDVDLLPNGAAATPTAVAEWEQVRADALAALAAMEGAKRADAIFDIREYGAKVDGRELADAAIAAGSAVLTSPAYTFTVADIGKAVGISGAGFVSTDYATNANDGVLISSIVSVSGGAATLAHTAVNTVSGATACFGTPDDDAFAAAQNAAAPAHGTVFIPPGRTIVTRSLALRSYVSWAGAGRDTSWVEVIMSAGLNPEDRNWLYKTPPYPWLYGVHVHDFGVQARYHIRPLGYVSDIKPLNFWGMSRPIVERMQCQNFPATALPFDASRDGVVIRDNLIVNPGRLCPPSNIKGGSGIGIGVSRTDHRYDYIVNGNSIIGVGSKAGTMPRGNNGIFIEAQDGPDNAPAPIGYRITGNFVQGMTCGIAENGSGQTIIAHNTILDCHYGINIAKGGVVLSYSGRDTLVHGNVIRGWAPKTGSTPVGIRHAVNEVRDFSGARIIDNIIVNVSGWGIRLDAPPSRVVTLNGVEIRGNRLRDITLTGIRVGVPSSGGLATDLAIVGNDLDNVGSADVAGDDSGIRLEMEVAHLTLTGNTVSAPNGSGLAILGAVTTGQITGNDIGSFGGAGVIAPVVRVFGNIGWPASIPSVTGSRGGNVALSSLLTKLQALGIISDATSV